MRTRANWTTRTRRRGPGGSWPIWSVATEELWPQVGQILSSNGTAPPQMRQVRQAVGSGAAMAWASTGGGDLAVSYGPRPRSGPPGAGTLGRIGGNTRPGGPRGVPMAGVSEEGTGRRHRRAEDRRRIFLAKITRAIAYGALSGFLFLYLSEDLGLSNLIEPPRRRPSRSWGPPARTSCSCPRSNDASADAARYGPSRSCSSPRPSCSTSPPARSLWWPPFSSAASPRAPPTTGRLASLEQAMLPSTMRRDGSSRRVRPVQLLANFAGAAGALLLSGTGGPRPPRGAVPPAAPHPWIGWSTYCWPARRCSPTAGSPRRSSPARPSTSRTAVPVAPEHRASIRAMAGLFAVDAFAGGMVINPLLTSYFVLAWHADAPTVGEILFVVGVVAGFSFLAASWLARPVRPPPDDGLHPSPVQPSPRPRPLHADVRARSRRPCRPLRPEPDGRSHAAGVHDGDGAGP